MNLRIRTANPDQLIRLGGAAPANQVFLPLHREIVSMPCGHQIPLASVIQYAVSMGHEIAIMDDRGGAHQYGPRFAEDCKRVLSDGDRAAGLAAKVGDASLLLAMVGQIGAEACPLASPAGLARAEAIEAIEAAARGLSLLAEDLRRVSNADSEVDPNAYDEPEREVFRILDEQGREIERTEVLLPARA